MAKITRQTLKVFGIDAGGSDIGVFGSLAAGTPTYSNVIATIQSLPAWSTGWAAETIATDRPALEDMNAICHVLSYGVCYLHQMGIPEWDSGTTYYADSYCQVSGVIYYSLQNDNLNKNPTSEPTYWTAGFKGMSYMDLSTNQTVATGTKTFAVSPIVPTQPAGDNTQKVASTAFVQLYKGTKVNDFPTGMQRAAVALSGNGAYTSVNGQYGYMVMGKNSSGEVVMVSGVANTGTIIPLPTGCAESACHWAAWPLCISGIDTAMSGWELSIAADRTVTIRARNNNWV